MIDKIKEKWADEGAAFSDDAGLIVQAITDMATGINTAVSSLESILGKIEIPKPDTDISKSIKALSAKMNKAPVVNLSSPDFADLKESIVDVIRQQGKALATIEALLRILNEPKTETMKEFSVEFDRNSTTQRIQGPLIIRQIR